MGVVTVFTTLIMSSQSLKRSPSVERVHHYLQERFLLSNSSEAVRLPSVRQVAKELGVSTATVYYAYRQLAAEGKVGTKAGGGTYSIPVAPVSKKYAFALGTPAADYFEGQWSFKMVNGIFRAVSGMSERIHLYPLRDAVFEPMSDPARFIDLLKKESPEVDGLLLPPYGRMSETIYRALSEHYHREEKPCIFVHPIAIHCTENFVSPDYYGSVREIVSVWKQTGRQRVAMLFEAGSEGSVSHALRLSAMLAAIHADGSHGIEFVTIPADLRWEEDGYRAVKEWLAEGKALPDAIYATGDLLAAGALRALEEAGIGVPEEVSVVGSSGVDSTAPGLTVVAPPFLEIGHAAVRMLISQIESRHFSSPGKYLPFHWKPGQTTREAENALLSPSQALEFAEAPL